MPAQTKGDPPKEYPAGANRATEWFLRQIIEAKDKKTLTKNKSGLQATFSPTPVRIDYAYHKQEWEPTLGTAGSLLGLHPDNLVAAGKQGSSVAVRAEFLIFGPFGAGSGLLTFVGPPKLGDNSLTQFEAWTKVLQQVKVQWLINSLQDVGSLTLYQYPKLYKDQKKENREL